MRYYKRSKKNLLELPIYSTGALARELSEYLYMDQKTVFRFLQIAFFLILNRMKEGYRVQAHKFGEFYCKEYWPMQIADPVLRFPVTVPKRMVPKFSAYPFARWYISPYAWRKWKRFREKADSYQKTLRLFREDMYLHAEMLDKNCPLRELKEATGT